MRDRERSRALPQMSYRDPALVAEIAELRSCHGCAHETTHHIAGTKVLVCEKNKKHGKKCKSYEEKTRCSPG